MAPRFQFVAGSLALDFVNTVGDRLDSGHSRDYFTEPAEMLRWLDHAGLGAGGARLSWRAMNRLVAFRELLYRVFRPFARGGAPLPADVAALGRVAAQARARQALRGGADGFAWGWAADVPAWQRALYRLATEAVDLLLSEDRLRIRQCEDERCGWLFIDRSRGERRRWCSMADCGNRAKARRHYSRQRRSLSG